MIGTFSGDLFLDFGSLGDLSVRESNIFKIPLYLFNLVLDFERRICEDDVLMKPELAGRRNQEFVHTNLQMVFGSSKVEAVDLCGEGDCRVDQEPIVGELQDLFGDRNNIHLTMGHGIFKMLSVEGSEAGTFMTSLENAKLFAEVYVADLLTAFQIIFSQVDGQPWFV